MRTLLPTLIIVAVCAAAVAGESSFPNRLAQAKVGEWVLLEEVSSAEDTERVKMTVVEVADGVVSVKREHLDDDGNVDETERHDINIERYNQRMASVAKRATEITQEFVVIKDKEFPVTAVAFVGESKTADGNEREFKIWFTDALPIGGIAKTWSSDPDLPSAEVVDFGF